MHDCVGSGIEYVLHVCYIIEQQALDSAKEISRTVMHWNKNKKRTQIEV